MSPIYYRLAAYGLMLVGFLLRVLQLNDVAVEKAEMMSILWFIREGLPDLLTHNKDLNNHPLNSLLAYLTSLGNESVFSLRWHSVIIGLVTVAVVMRLARRWFGEREGLVAGLLIATSAYHVALSQRSRGYVGIVGFTALGFYFAWRAVQTGRRRYWLGFVLASVLNIYSHLYGVMAVATIGVVALGLLVWRRARRPTEPRVSEPRASASGIAEARVSASGTTEARVSTSGTTGPRASPSGVQRTSGSLARTLAPALVSLVAALIISGALYLPMWSDTVAVAGQDNQFRQSDVRHAETYGGLEQVTRLVHEAIRPFSLAEDSTRLRLGDAGIHYGPFDRAAAPAEGDVGYYLSLGSWLLGLLVCLARFRGQAVILLAWLGLPFVAQLVGGLVVPGAYYRGRFLGFIYVPYLLTIVPAWPGLGDCLGGRVRARRLFRVVAGGLGWAGLAALVVLNLVWLGAYYSAAATEDWGAVARHITLNKQPGDLIVCGQYSKTPCSFDLTVRTDTDVSEYDKFVFDTLNGNRAYASWPGRVWMVMPHLSPSQLSRLRESVQPTNYWLAGDPAYGQVGWVLLDAHRSLGDNLGAAMQLGVALSLGVEDTYRYTISLAEIRLTQDRLPAAEEAYAQASALLPAVGGPDGTFRTVSEQMEYARRVSQAATDLPPDAVRVHLEMGNLARLIAYETDRETLTPGDALRITLYWLPLRPISRDLVSYVHVTDLAANLLAETSGVPAAGRSPTSSWEPGQMVVDTHTVTLKADVRTPLAARLEAGLFDPGEKEFVKPIDAAGQYTGSAIGQARVVPVTWPVVTPSHALDASFGDLISLAGYDWLSDPPRVVFYWRAETSITKDYTVFVHLLNSDGQLAGQMDGPPLGGDYPTSWWAAGDVIVDQRLLPNPVSGAYRLLVGWYRLEDGSRLPVTDGSGDSVMLGPVQIP